MTAKRFVSEDDCCGYYTEIIDNEKELDLLLTNPKKNLTIEELVDLLNELHETNEQLRHDATILIQANQDYRKENEQLKSQLYYDDEEGVCNICKHHYLVKDDKAELGYYNSRCKKGHYECARVSLKYCEDFEGVEGMTKRFTINGKEIIQNKQVWCVANSEHCADVIATAMNELAEENEQLKQEMGDLGTAHAEEITKIEDEFDEELLKLEKENEQLKKENNMLNTFITMITHDGEWSNTSMKYGDVE